MSKTKIRRKTRKLRKNKTHKKGKLIKRRSKRAGMYQFPPRASTKRGRDEDIDDEEESRDTRHSKVSKASTIESQKSDKEPLNINTDYMIEDFEDFEVNEPTEEDLKNRPSSTRTLRPSSTTTISSKYDDTFSLSGSSHIDTDDDNIRYHRKSDPEFGLGMNSSLSSDSHYFPDFSSDSDNDYFYDEENPKPGLGLNKIILGDNEDNVDYDEYVKYNNLSSDSHYFPDYSSESDNEEKPGLTYFKSISSSDNSSNKSGGKTKKSKKSKKTKKTKKTKKRHNYKKMRGGMLLNTNYGVTNPYPQQDQHD